MKCKIKQDITLSSLVGGRDAIVRKMGCDPARVVYHAGDICEVKMTNMFDGDQQVVIVRQDKADDLPDAFNLYIDEVEILQEV